MAEQLNGASIPYGGSGHRVPAFEDIKGHVEAGEINSTGVVIGGDGSSNGAKQVWGSVTKEDRDAAIKMLPNATLHSCDACNKDITGLCYMRCDECKETKEQPHDVDLCVDCFFSGQEPFNHKKTHAYRVMDKLQTPIYTEDWTAAEELSLADQTRRLGLGAWEDIADSKLFYRGKSGSELNARYLDTYLCQHGSVLPPYYLHHREDGTVEKVPIPLTDPDSCDPSLRGVKVKSQEIRSRTIAELGTEPQYRYTPSWDALAKRQDEAMAREKAIADTAAAEASTAATSSANGTDGSGPVVGSSSVDAMEVDGGSAPGEGVGSRDNILGILEGRGKRGAGGGQTTAEKAAEKAAAAKITQTKKKKRKFDKVNKNKEEERAIKEWAEKLPGADLSGYFPLRGDFDVEHDNSAEELLANMEFRQTDHASEKQLKLDVIAVYNHRLDEREKRKAFVIQHNLLDFKKPPMGTKKRLKDDRELIARLRPFARFHSPAEHDELIENLLLAKRMRQRIEQLQGYREHGITTLAEGVEFDLAVKRRSDEAANKKHRESASYLYDGPANSSKGTMRDRSSRYISRQKEGGGALDGTADGGDDSRGGNLMDLTGAPGGEFLSPAERMLCSQLHLLPGYYLVVKEAMIQECARAGCLKRKNLSSLAVMDSSRLDKMYDFFTTCGWVSDMPQDRQHNGSGSSNA